MRRGRSLFSLHCVRYIEHPIHVLETHRTLQFKIMLTCRTFVWLCVCCSVYSVSNDIAVHRQSTHLHIHLAYIGFYSKQLIYDARLYSNRVFHPKKYTRAPIRFSWLRHVISYSGKVLIRITHSLYICVSNAITDTNAFGIRTENFIK